MELVRGERMLEAIAYSRKHLSPWAELYQADLQRALAALAFRSGAMPSPPFLHAPHALAYSSCSSASSECKVNLLAS